MFGLAALCNAISGFIFLYVLYKLNKILIFERKPIELLFISRDLHSNPNSFNLS